MPKIKEIQRPKTNKKAHQPKKNYPCFKAFIVNQLYFWPKHNERLFFAQDSKHLGAASRASPGHGAELDAPFAFRANFLGVFHIFLGLAFDAIGFGHMVIITKPLNKARGINNVHTPMAVSVD